MAFPLSKRTLVHRRLPYSPSTSLSRTFPVPFETSPSGFFPEVVRGSLIQLSGLSRTIRLRGPAEAPVNKTEDDETSHYFPAEGQRDCERCYLALSVRNEREAIMETIGLNSGQVDRLNARCLRCGDPQIIQRHRVMSVTANAQTNGEDGDVATFGRFHYGPLGRSGVSGRRS
jgi:hypothetical protein